MTYSFLYVESVLERKYLGFFPFLKLLLRLSARIEEGLNLCSVIHLHEYRHRKHIDILSLQKFAPKIKLYF